MLIFNSSISVAFARSKHVITEDRCSGNYNNVGIKTSTTCCYESWDEDRVTHKISNYMKWCRICDTSATDALRSEALGDWSVSSRENRQCASSFRQQYGSTTNSTTRSNALQSLSTSQQTTAKCPNGLAPDSNYNCPTAPTTTNQQVAPLQSLGGISVKSYARASPQRKQSTSTDRRTRINSNLKK